MSEQRNELTEREETKLREAVDAWVSQDRHPISARERLARLRGSTADTANPWQPTPHVTSWPAALVAILGLGLLGFVVAWGGTSRVQLATKDETKRRRVAEDDNGAHEKKTKPDDAREPD